MFWYNLSIRLITLFLIIRVLNEDIVKGVVYSTEFIKGKNAFLDLIFTTMERNKFPFADVSFVFTEILSLIMTMTIYAIHW